MDRGQLRNGGFNRGPDPGNNGFGHGPGGGPGHGPFPPPPPPPTADVVPVYRFFLGNDHFQTLNYQEGINAHMGYEGISCYANGDHLSTTNPNEFTVAGFQVEGIQGYVAH
jgi:hypothetical protein